MRSIPGDNPELYEIRNINTFGLGAKSAARHGKNYSRLITPQQNPIESGYRRLASSAAIASLFAYAVILCVTPASVNEIAQYYHASGASLGWLYRMCMLGFFSTVIAGGHYGDRRGKLPVMVCGSVMMAGGALLFAWTGSFAGAILAIFIMGAGGGFAEGAAMAILADLYWGARRTAMLNWAQVVFGIGAVGAPLVVARLLKTGVDWRMGYTWTSVVCLCSALLAFAAFKTGNERPVADHQDSTDGWREILSDKLIFWLSVGIMLYVAAEAGQVNWMAAFFKRDLGASAPLAASSVALYWAGITLGRMAATRLSRRMADVTLILWFLVAATFWQVVLLLAKSPAVALVAVPALGFFMGPIWPTILSRASAARPEQSGLLFGIIMSFGCMGAAVFPPFMGKASDVVGMRAALWMCVALLVINLFIFVALRIREASAHQAASPTPIDTTVGS